MDHFFRTFRIDTLQSEKSKAASGFVSLTEYLFLFVSVFLIYFSLFFNFWLPPYFASILKFVFYAFFIVITCMSPVIFIGSSSIVSNSLASIFGVFSILFAFFSTVDLTSNSNFLEFPHDYVQSSGPLFVLFFSVGLLFMVQCLFLLAFAVKRPPVRPYFTIQFGLTILLFGQHLALFSDQKGAPLIGVTGFDFHITLVVVAGILVFNGIRFTKVLFAPLPRMKADNLST